MKYKFFEFVELRNPYGEIATKASLDLDIIHQDFELVCWVLSSLISSSLRHHWCQYRKEAYAIQPINLSKIYGLLFMTTVKTSPKRATCPGKPSRNLSYYCYFSLSRQYSPLQQLQTLQNSRLSLLLDGQLDSLQFLSFCRN